MSLESRVSLPTQERLAEKQDKTRRWLEADPTIPQRTSELIGAFNKLFLPEGERVNPNELTLSCSPGRVEDLGNHTDGHEGLTASHNIKNNLLILGKPRNDNKVRIATLNEEQGETRVIEFEIGSIDELWRQKLNDESNDSWTNYVKGVVWSLKKRGIRTRGIDAVIQSTIPSSGGVSSSAALELATGNLITTISNQNISPKEMVEICYDAERDYVGVPCGYLDQATEALADGGFLIIDHRGTEEKPFTYEKIEIDMAKLGYSSVIGYDPASKRRLKDGKYATRKEDTLSALPDLRHLLRDDSIRALRDVSPEQLEEVRTQLLTRRDQTIVNYATHIVYENNRVLSAQKALEQEDIKTFGRLKTEAGASSIYLYGVAEGAPELVNVYETIKRNREAWGVAGCRNMGGGQNGTTESVVETEKVPVFTTELNKDFMKKYGRPYNFIESTPAPSAGVLDIKKVLQKQSA